MARQEVGNITLTLAAATIGQITDFQAATRTLNVRTTHYIGSDEPVKTPTNFDIGQHTFTIDFDPDDTGHTALATDRDAKTLGSYEIVDSGATKGTLAFTAYCVSVGGISGTAGETTTAPVVLDVVAITEWAI